MCLRYVSYAVIIVREGGEYMAEAKKIVKPVKRCKQKRARLWLLDLRGIRNHPPNEKEKKKLKQNYRSYSGQKPVFASPEQLEKEVEQYFESCYGPLIDWKKHELVKDKDGNEVRVQTEPFTVAGLAYYLGIPTESLKRYAKGWNDKFEDEDEMLCSGILDRAKQVIETYAEKRLYDRDGVNGARFVLDHHFRMITRREEAEIEAIEKNNQYKQEELELKKQMLDIGSDDDGQLQITIVRKED